MEYNIMGSGIFYVAVIALGIYALICHECGKAAKRKNLKYFNAFLIAFFGSPVVGFLYIIARQLPAVEIAGEDRSELGN